MCTAINFNGFFGRTLDYECGFGEKCVAVPEGFSFEFRHRDKIKSSYAIVGMARVENRYPLFFDAMNSEGVAMAGLNFVGNAYFPKAEKGDLATFELIPYILSQADCLDSARELMYNAVICDTPFSKGLPAASLHWMVADAKGSIVIESTEEGLNIYDAPVGVLTNDPPFPHQITNLSGYLNLTSSPAENRFSHSLELIPFSRGMGTIGLPGDWSSRSRFVRAAFVRENAVKEESPAHFFRIMSSVSVPKGCMLLENGETEYTRYVSCMDLKNGIYYYTEYDSMHLKSMKI